MFFPGGGRRKLSVVLRHASPRDRFGAAALALGIVLALAGMLLEENSGPISGAAIRAAGGVLILGGLAAIFGPEPRRRTALLDRTNAVIAWYMRLSANWDTLNRAGLAGVLVGLILAIPAVVAQILFGIGAVVIAPAIILFWGGIGLLLYGLFRRWRGVTQPDRRRANRGGKGRK